MRASLERASLAHTIAGMSRALSAHSQTNKQPKEVCVPETSVIASRTSRMGRIFAIIISVGIVLLLLAGLLALIRFDGNSVSYRRSAVMKHDPFKQTGIRKAEFNSSIAAAVARKPWEPSDMIAI